MCYAANFSFSDKSLPGNAKVEASKRQKITALIMTRLFKLDDTSRMKIYLENDAYIV